MCRATGTALLRPETMTMWTRLNLRLIGSTGSLALLVTLVEAGRKWH